MCLVLYIWMCSGSGLLGSTSRVRPLGWVDFGKRLHSWTGTPWRQNETSKLTPKHIGHPCQVNLMLLHLLPCCFCHVLTLFIYSVSMYVQCCALNKTQKQTHLFIPLLFPYLLSPWHRKKQQMPHKILTIKIESIHPSNSEHSNTYSVSKSAWCSWILLVFTWLISLTEVTHLVLLFFW